MEENPVSLKFPEFYAGINNYLVYFFKRGSGEASLVTIESLQVGSRDNNFFHTNLLIL